MNYNLVNTCKNTFYLNPSNAKEIISVIKQFKDKTGGIDKINMKVIKKLSNLIAYPLQHIFNLCILYEKWPDCLKQAEIIPIYKNGDKHYTTNYRPISLISNIAKIFEKLIHIRIVKFLTKFKILSDGQFGFRKNIGTKEVLAKITNILFNKIDNGLPTIVTYLDLAKAFDTINYNILFHKLISYGLRGKILGLLRNYLSDRKQKLIVNETDSSLTEVTIGVPEGTILGPLLFIIYINDIFNVLPINSIISYADDTAIIVSEKSWSLARDKMVQYLSLAYKWLNANQLSLNIDKTVFVTYGAYQNSIPLEIDIKIGNFNLKRVNSCKYLGVIFDCFLRWDIHIQQIVGRTRYLLFIFKKMKYFMDVQTLQMLYYALFQNVAFYGIIAWGGAYNNVILPLNNLRNRLLKIIHSSNSYNNAYLNNRQAFILDSIMNYYEELKNKFLAYPVNTRNKSIDFKASKSAAFKNNYITAIQHYNKLPNNLKTLNLSKENIKMKIKNHILNNL